MLLGAETLQCALERKRSPQKPLKWGTPGSLTLHPAKQSLPLEVLSWHPREQGTGRGNFELTQLLKTWAIFLEPSLPESRVSECCVLDSGDLPVCGSPDVRMCIVVERK